MVVLAPPRFTVLLAAAFFGSGGCVGGPNLSRELEVRPGERTTVRLMQFQQNQVLTLQNASSGSANEVYSDRRTDPLAKVVDDAQLQALLDVLAEKGLFKLGAASVPPDARDALVVQQNDRRWVFSRRLAGMQQEELQFHEAKAYFLSVWNGATSYHSADVDRADLRAEQARVKSDAREAVRKIDPPTGGRQ
jgi:hypothetical protein